MNRYLMASSEVALILIFGLIHVLIIHLTQNFTKKLKEAGFNWIGIGVESGNQVSPPRNFKRTF